MAIDYFLIAIDYFLIANNVLLQFIYLNVSCLEHKMFGIEP